ncbi:MAG: hypothetical protein R3B37_13020 [Nitrospira sp.]|nr:hypothetical protein [Nitrospira sp.]
MIRFDIRLTLVLPLLLLGCLPPVTMRAKESPGVRPLRSGMASALATLPSHTHLLFDQTSIEQFLVALDGSAPDWTAIYGKGHQDPGHDERLFALNRERDARREGKEPLQWSIAFVWFGELSRFDEQEGGFRVALGPKFTQTTWGDVRFKPEDVPSTLIASTGHETADLRARLQQGRPVQVSVVMIGRLIPEESLIYDFSHDTEGRGLIMPVVVVEAVEFVLESAQELQP